jgi:hypothetical protein
MDNGMDGRRPIGYDPGPCEGAWIYKIFHIVFFEYQVLK